MAAVTTDPYTELQLLELSHEWGHGAPSLPGQDDVIMFRAVKFAQHGVMAHRIKTVMHTGTHMNAPIHLVQRASDLSEIPVERFFGNGVVLNIPKKSYEVITAKDLESASPDVQQGDVVIIVSGWHHKYSDAIEYFGESPGLSKCAAQWLVKKDCRFVGVDMPQVDHPLATSLGPHRGGPLMKRLANDYTKATGLDPTKEHPEWNIAHKTLLSAGIPTVEQVGGDVDLLAGKRATFAATPWKFKHGDACPVRLVAMMDPSGKCRIDAGN
ncbi:Cyclase family protein [Desulfamplus magnetovallimortis]|uniref:Cyclase family protein n=1 Tax=Desulfamplus magnetovallimortis TaxID=1246637 RepID=A0A1W1HJE8_9BACT|nr:cyclase family protein [Desulfamplus magnetovallimortis]SLM32590.1 Cyclase family protein [Desulfamplus magnetovallimortis]